MDYTCVLNMKRYIEKHFTEDITLDFIAKKFGYSKFHLSRMFAESTGKTIHAYIMERRLFEAEWLLKNTDTPIIEIAQMIGYTSQQSFTKAFRQRFECSPASYRNNHYVLTTTHDVRHVHSQAHNHNTIIMRMERMAA
ncbi:helix-turn-helix transcriptional regulator [Anaerosporobacter sp.]